MVDLNVYILDQNDFSTIDVVTQVISLVWIERYNEFGDFILRCPYKYHYWDIMKTRRYVSIDESDRLMIIENVELGTDNNGVDYIEVSGQSYESVLNYRIVSLEWPHTCIKNGHDYTVTLSGTKTTPSTPGHWEIHGSIQDGILYFMTGLFDLDDCPNGIEECWGNTRQDWVGAQYRIRHFHITRSIDPNVTSKTGDWNGAYDYVGDKIREITKRHSLGFRITFDNLTGDVYFGLYAGTDRRDSQTAVLPVVFSNEYQNLLSSKVYQSTGSYKNSYLAAWADQYRNAGEDYPSFKEGDGETRWWGGAVAAVGVYERIGLVVGPEFPWPWNYDGSEPPSTEEQIEVWDAAVKEIQAAISDFLYECKETTVFEAEVVPDGYFKYGVDYFLGDLVTIRTHYGVVAGARVAEVTRSWDVDGYKISPVFEIEEFNVYDPDAGDQTNPTAKEMTFNDR